ncbi:hypothetical protein ABFX02_08G104700 [Erythranthe guttata]
MEVCFPFTTIVCLLFYYAIFLNNSSLAAADHHILSANQTLSDAQTLISPNQVFELGFFSSGNKKFLGIWYKNTPDVVVWVANRNNPITNDDNRGAPFLEITRNATLVIYTRRTAESTIIVIWSSSNSSATFPSRKNPSLRLLDNGNLVLLDDDKESYYIWQSFDYPTDTRLPGMPMVYDSDIALDKHLTSWKSYDDPSPGEFVYRIVNQGLPERVIFKGAFNRRYRSGAWNGLYMNIPTFYNKAFTPELVFDKENKLVSLQNPYDSNSSILTRMVLHQSGTLHRYTLNDEKNGWDLVYTIPKDPCDEYAKCGPNGICRIDRAPICECLKGFEPNLRSDWDSQDWSGGCRRISPLSSLQNGDGFLEVKGVKIPDMLAFWMNNSMSISECRDECLTKYNCTAYTQPYINNGGNGCLLWFGDLVDTRVLPGADKNQNIYIRLPISELENKKKRRGKLILISAVVVGVVVCALLFLAILVIIRRKRKAEERKNEDLELPSFKFAMVAAATNNFSKENIIGEGGFGLVYKGNLSAEEEIAVKRLSGTSGQGLEEFKNEVILFSKLQHSNLVQLLGCCVTGDERMLIYEYLQNKSLDGLIFDQNKRTVLTWPMRYDIIMGIAKGLLYLHQDSRLKIIHRDLKTSNILLDENFNPKISDFGLARSFKVDQIMARTRRVVGTYGYMAPEYAIDGKFSVKSDVFSMGVVILEIVSGKKNRGFRHQDHHHSLLGHAWCMWKENKAMELMDECLNESFDELQVRRCIKVGLLCIQKLVEDRPTMSHVILMLGCEGEVVPEPKEPGFFLERSCSTSNLSTTPNQDSSGHTITITELEGR